MKKALAAILLALAVTLAVAGPLAWQVAHGDTNSPDGVPATQVSVVDEHD